MRLGISSFISDILSTSSNVCFCWTEGKVESNLHHPAAATAASLAVDVLWSKAPGLLCLWVLLRTQLACWAVVDLISYQSLVWSRCWSCCWVQDWCAERPEVLKWVHTFRRCLSHQSKGQTRWLFLVTEFLCVLFILPSVKSSCRGLHAATGHSDATPSTEMHRYISHHVADMKQTQTKVSEYVHKKRKRDSSGCHQERIDVEEPQGQSCSDVFSDVLNTYLTSSRHDSTLF